ncbi:MAG: ATP-binding protein [Rhodocyclaceae bacterium]|nr:ATP-binding protein [Rhodocyclaceae bacterium]
MRDIGYSLETALSDIVDNSIAAGATLVRIVVDPSATAPRVAILDNGCGMSEPDLLEAMRAGSRSPLAERGGMDLGRFGLGLKTASFSQCRRLTVVSKKGGQVSAAIWDLDHVAATDRWEVELPTEWSGIPHAEELVEDGTLVLWEHIDRILGEASGDRARELLARRLSETEDHLELVFHRFLAGEPGRSRISVEVNAHRLTPRDPFGTSHATQKDPEETCLIKGHRITLQTYTLPHHSKLNTRQYEQLGGAAGYLRNQGFYLYRERRLIIWGTWFGLARQRPITQLTRVRIDMPRELDAEWKIDVKKASAQPPAILRERLSGLVDRICEGSRRVYTHKGQKLNPDERLEAWTRIQDKGVIRYRINSTHPIMESLNAELSVAGRARLQALIRLAETGLPIDAIFADKGGDPRSVGTDTLDEAALNVLAVETYRGLNSGTTERSARVLDMMQVAEPFASGWSTVQKALAEAFSWR